MQDAQRLDRVLALLGVVQTNMTQSMQAPWRVRVEAAWVMVFFVVSYVASRRNFELLPRSVILRLPSQEVLLVLEEIPDKGRKSAYFKDFSHHAPHIAFGRQSGIFRNNCDNLRNLGKFG